MNDHEARRRAEGLAADGHIGEAIREFERFLDSRPTTQIGAKQMLGVSRWDGSPVEHLVVIPYVRAFGEFFHFGRFIRNAKERCDRVTLMTHSDLIPLAKRCSGADSVVTSLTADEVATADAYTMYFLNMAAPLGLTYGTPMKITARPERIPALDASRRHVGVCWAASDSISGSIRSCSVEDFAPLGTMPGTQIRSENATATLLTQTTDHTD